MLAYLFACLFVFVCLIVFAVWRIVGLLCLLVVFVVFYLFYVVTLFYYFVYACVCLVGPLLIGSPAYVCIYWLFLCLRICVCFCLFE